MNVNYLIDITACPIEGQIRQECADHPSCHPTCNSTGPVVCLPSCVPNGCQCPPGTIINEDRTKCVSPSGCKGTELLVKNNSF